MVPGRKGGLRSQRSASGFFCLVSEHFLILGDLSTLDGLFYGLQWSATEAFSPWFVAERSFQSR